MREPQFDTVTSLRKKLEEYEQKGHGDLPVVVYLEICEDGARCSNVGVVDTDDYKLRKTFAGLEDIAFDPSGYYEGVPKPPYLLIAGGAYC